MQVYFDGAFVNAELPILGTQDRALQYGDGLFETIVFKNGKSSLLNRHLKRLIAGLDVLQIQPPKIIFNKDELEAVVSRLIHLSTITEDTRLKLQVWRKSGGFYTPKNNEAHLFMTVSPMTYNTPIKAHAGISKKVKLAPSILSRYKTVNALPYIIASIEREEKKLDELIIPDMFGNVSECTYSNIFWEKDSSFFTPSLDTGCIEGVMRNYLIEQLNDNGHIVKEVKSPLNTLLTANKVFISNATGVYAIGSLNNCKFDTNIDAIRQLVP